jgi:two-component system, OmpR family, phosphate regulon sensor histidine kinase PhoR
MEHDISDKSKSILDKAIESELYLRFNSGKSKIKFSTLDSDESTHSKDKSSIESQIEVTQTSEINLALQYLAMQEGNPCKVDVLDSIYSESLFEAIGFVPKHTLSLIDASSKKERKPTKYTFYGKITEHRFAEVVLVNPMGSILRKAQMIVAVSIFLVVVIGFVLMYLLRTTLREAKFVSFIKEYTHALTHELKTPISGIYVASSQLASGILEDKPEARQKYYDACKTSSSKLLSTVDRILLVAKAERSKITTNPTEVELKPYMETIVNIHRSNNFRQKQVTLTCSCSPENLTAKIDAFLMENVLNNLIDNAMKYSDNSVSIDVRAIQVAEGVEFRVKDTGFGIAENEIKHVFDNFERGNKGIQKGIDGFGIGLNYVNKVVRAHKGSIRVESKEGEGSEFIIVI